MRLYRVLLTPWVATPRSARWLFVLVLVLAVLGDSLVHLYRFVEALGASERAWQFDALVCAVANVACWLLLMPNGLLLALSARRLRVPGISGDVAWSLPLYAVLGIGVPMLFLLPQGHVLEFAVVQLLVMMGAMLVMVLPYYLAIASYLLAVMTHGALSHFISIPGLSDPRFALWGGVLAVVLLLILAWRWRQLLQGRTAEHGLRAPGLVNFRRYWGPASNDRLTDAGLMRVRPTWLLARPDLQGVGPQAPVKSLRIALGGVYLPQTILGRLCQWGWVALSLAVGALVFFLATRDDHGLLRLLSYLFSEDGFRTMSWMLPIFSVMVVVLPMELLTLRWGRVNAELPLLGLLPGLGSPERSKQMLLRTAMEQPARWLGLLLLVGCLCTVMLNIGWSVVLALVLVALGCLGYLCAMALSLFGGRPLSNFCKSLLMIGMFVLLSLTVLLPPLGQSWNALYAGRALDALFAAWLLLALFLAWLGHRGWCALQRRPHAFLPY